MTDLLGAGEAWGAAVRLLSATCAVALVPGIAITLFVAPRPTLTLLELLAYAMAVSFALIELLTIAAVTAHFAPTVSLTIGAAATVLTAFWAMRRPACRVTMSIDDAIVVSLLIVLGICLYRTGSPVDWFEDQVHVAIVQRLSALQAPRLDNLYFVPGIVYTYPFPGTHYLMALIACVSDLDPLFVYHKLRFFWGPAALVMLYAIARLVFGPGGVAAAVTATAVALVFNGTFAAVPGFMSGWGQLTPYSHASDVAMTVLLPALLVMAFAYILATSARERGFFLAVAAVLTLMLTIVHIREVVQVAVYLGCLLAAAAAVRRFRPYVRPAGVLLGIVVAIAASYRIWQTQALPLVDSIVQGQREQLRSVLRSSPVADLIATPASTLLASFLPNHEQISGGMVPLFLLAGPAVFLLFRERPLVWLASLSTVVYLAIMTIPALAIPYIFLTYFEILYTPVRNVIVFVYLFAGAGFYAAVVAGTHALRPPRPITVVSMAAAGLAAGAFAIVVATALNRTAQGYLAPAMGAYALALVLASTTPSVHRSVRFKSIVAVGMAMGLLALLPERAPAERVTRIAVRWTAGLPPAEQASLERTFSLRGGEPHSARTEEVNVWNYQLGDTSRDNIQALVTHRRVADTNDIDRASFTVAPQPPPTDNPFIAVERFAWLQYPGWTAYLAVAVLMWMLAFVVPALITLRNGPAAATSRAAMAGGFHHLAIPFAALLVPFALVTTRPTLSPLYTGDARPRASTPRDLVAAIPCRTTPAVKAPFSEDILGTPLMLPMREACPPDAALIDWVRANVPVESVLAINRWNPHLPSMFLPQQVVVFSHVEEAFRNEPEFFAAYWTFYEARLRSRQVQPFFNGVESLAERDAFVKALGVTHVLVDPAYHDEMRGVLDPLTDRFRLRYSGARWAVYEVISRTLPAVPVV